MGSPASGRLTDAIRQYYPDLDLKGRALSLEQDGDALYVSQALFPSTVYTDSEKTSIGLELRRLSNLVPTDDPLATRPEDLLALNAYLSTRTTLVGSKPSIADIAAYVHLSRLAKSWSEEEKTGEQGYHHIVRHLDFVENSTLFSLSPTNEDRLGFDLNRVLFFPRASDSKQEKERKKKEKASKPTVHSSPMDVVGQRRQKQDDDGPRRSTQSTIKATTKGDGNSTLGNSIVSASSTRKEKKEKGSKGQKQAPKEILLSPSLIDLRVGHILKAEVHPNADSLFVSTIAVGDDPGTDNTSEYEGAIVRTVCSGLNGLVPLEEMQNRKVVAVCNLKPVTMRGIKSAAMVLAASPRLKEGEADNHAGPVELVNPPSGAAAGDRVWFDGWEGEPEAVLNPKKKVWDMCQVGFTTTDDLGVAFEKAKVEQLNGEAGEGKPDIGLLRVKDGASCTVHSLKGAVVR